jgi:hypothetical protein
MTQGKKEQMMNLRRVLVDDIDHASDEEILTQFAEDIGSPDSNAARMRAMFESTVLLANKERLHVARVGAAASQVLYSSPSPIPIEKARELLRHALAAHAHDSGFTLAARKESELSDADVLEMLESMRELGLLE